MSKDTASTKKIVTGKLAGKKKKKQFQYLGYGVFTKQDRGKKVKSKKNKKQKNTSIRLLLINDTQNYYSTYIFYTYG